MKAKSNHTKKGGFRSGTHSENRPEMIILTVRFRAENRKRGKISFYFYISESMKKARNPLWDRAFCLKYLLRGSYMEAPPGIGPGNKGFADLCLTAWLWCHIKFNV